MFRGLIVKHYFKNAIRMFERMEIEEYIYDVVVEPSYKNLQGNMPIALVTAVK